MICLKCICDGGYSDRRKGTEGIDLRQASVARASFGNRGTDWFRSSHEGMKPAGKVGSVSKNLKIAYTEHAWNPVVGCTRISSGCDHCYAESMIERLQKSNVQGYESGFAVTLRRERLSQPLTRDTGTHYFVCTTGDLFHPEVPDDYLDEILSVIEQTPRHFYYVLTKRSERLPGFFAGRRVPANLHLGVSVENRGHLNRIDHLRQVRAPVRFLYLEPLLEDPGEFQMSGLDWVVVGAETGVGARPTRKGWARGLVSRARAADLPIYVKETVTSDTPNDRGDNARAFRGRTWNVYFTE